jgi:superkiller protein 3
MSYLLESLGRGLLGQLVDAFERRLEGSAADDPDALAAQLRYATTSADLALRTGAAYLRHSRLSDARRAFEHARGIPAATRNATLGLACVQEELGRSDEALRMLEAVRALEPDDAAIAFAIALCHERSGRLDEAREAYLRSVELCPRLRNGHERLGAIAVRERDWVAAEMHYTRLAKLDPADLDVLLTLGTLELHAGRACKAIETFHRALLVEPEATGEALEGIEELTTDGKLASAIGALEKLVAKYPGVSEFHVHLGDLYVKAGQDGQAAQQYRTALEIHPTFLEATVKLGTQHLRTGQFHDAARIFNRAAELNDRLLLAFVGLGLAQHDAGRTADSSATFDLAAGLAPNSTLLVSETTRLHLRVGLGRAGDATERAPADDDQGDLPAPETDGLLADAIRRNERLINENPVRADLHYRHALLLRHLGDSRRSSGALRRAVALAPSFSKAQVQLGVALRESGRRKEALDAFRAALTLRAEDVELHYQLAMLFASRGQFDLAVERIEREASGQRDVGAIQNNLALALQNIAMVDRVAASWNALAELCPDRTILDPSRFSGE